MNLDGIPESIPEERIQQLLTDLGLPLNQITTDGIRIGWNNITCTVYAVRPNGYRYVDETTNAPAVHHISIPIMHPDADDT